MIPVLYHVDPLDIENQTGSFGDAFAKRRDKAEKLQEWKDGFEEAINLPGWSTAHLRYNSNSYYKIPILKKKNLVSYKNSYGKILHWKSNGAFNLIVVFNIFGEYYLVNLKIYFLKTQMCQA